MVALLVLSYGQAIGITLVLGSHTRIYLALIGSEVESRSTVLSLFSQLYWAFWLILTLAVRYWKKSDRQCAAANTTNLSQRSNHLFLNFSTSLTMAVGCLMVVLRVLTYQRMSMTYYAQGICHIHLVFICLVVYNHAECRQFALRKAQSWPGISHAVATYHLMVAIYVVTTVGNSVRPIEVMV